MHGWFAEALALGSLALKDSSTAGTRPQTSLRQCVRYIAERYAAQYEAEFCDNRMASQKLIEINPEDFITDEIRKRKSFGETKFTRIEL